MTSTISSNNKHFSKLFKWAFRRNRAIMIVFSVLMLIGIVIDVQIITTIAYSRVVNNTDGLGTLGYGSIIIAQFGAIILSLISANHTFSFLHNKRSTDMFGAIPCTRSTLYFSHLLGGISAVALPFIIGSFIVMGLTCRSVPYFAIQLSMILFGLIGIAAVYSFTALISYCCGTTLDSTIITLSVNAIYIGVIGIFSYIMSSMIPGVNSDQIFNTPIVTLLTPFGFPFFLDYYVIGSQTTALWTTIIWTVLFTAGMVVSGCFAAKMRRAETAQNEFNIKWLPVAIKAGISVLAGLFGGAAAAPTSTGFSKMFVFAFWYILVGFGAFIIIHLIFSRGIKGKFLPSLLAYAGTTAAVLALTFGLTTGMGIDTYVPSPSNVSSITFGNGNDYGSATYTYSDPENIKTITEIHKCITESIEKDSVRPYYIGFNNEYYYNTDEELYSSYGGKFEDLFPLSDNTSFDFTYNKKIGFTTKRVYGYRSKSFDYQKIEALLKKLYNSEEYKRLSNPSIWKEDAKSDGKSPSHANLAVIAYNDKTSSYMQASNIELKYDEQFVKGLMSAIKKDIIDDKEYYRIRSFNSAYYNSNSTLMREKYYVISIYYKDQRGNDTYDYSTGYNYTSRVEAIIPENYTNTLNYLRANGYGNALSAPVVFSNNYDDDYCDDYYNNV